MLFYIKCKTPCADNLHQGSLNLAMNCIATTDVDTFFIADEIERSRRYLYYSGTYTHICLAFKIEIHYKTLVKDKDLFVHAA